MVGKELVTYLDNLYYVYRRVNQNHIMSDKIQDLKEFWHCDIVLKQKTSNNEVLMFLREIPEATIVTS
jgi:hypothetical protein